MVCLVALVSFGLFAVAQLSSASQQQQAQLTSGGAPVAVTGVASGSSTSTKGERGVRRTIDDATNGIASPFHGLTDRSSSAWGAHILQTLFVLLVYGFGLGYLARFIRVHA